MARRLEDKVAIITGTGGFGQGRAAASLFAKEGAKVVGCDKNEAGNRETVRMVCDAGGEMVSLEPLDLSNPDSAKKLVSLTRETYGRLDILYNNAASPRFAPLTGMSREDWEFTIRNELDLIYFLIKEAVPLMVESGGGSIINVSSISALRGQPFLGNFAHAAAKGGVLCATRPLAYELAPHGIRVNTIAPGLIRNNPPGSESPLMADPEKRRILLEKILLKRIGEPEEIAKAALFLASDESSYVTGTTLVVDGGWTAN